MNGIYTHEFISKCFNIYRFEASFKITDLIHALEANKHNLARIMISEALDKVEEEYLEGNALYERYIDYKHMYNTLMIIQDNKLHEDNFKLLQQGRDIE